jgi:hypothetical protein
MAACQKPAAKIGVCDPVSSKPETVLLHVRPVDTKRRVKAGASQCQ